MNLSSQRRIASDIMKVGSEKIWFNPENLERIKEAITKEDMRNLIKEGIVKHKRSIGTSKFRARKLKVQKRKKQKRGIGSRKGTANARLGKKIKWMNKIRLLRKIFKEYQTKKIIDPKTYTDLRKKAKGGYFRSQRHVKIYLNDNNLFLRKKK